MGKNTATTKQTSGAGFGFEEKVAAHFAVWMLLGSSPLFPKVGQVAKIEFQKRVDGYFLDDLVLTLTNEGHTWECSFSVKSNVQFSSTTAPVSFVEPLWEMYLYEGSNCFVVGRDCMGLITATLPSRIQTALFQDLLPKAHHQEPKALAARLTSTDPDSKSYTSEDVRSLFRSFACPKSLTPKRTVDDSDIAELLKHVIVMNFDFGSEPSADESRTVQMIGQLLQSSTPNNSSQFWNDLLMIVRRENEAGGYLDRTKLLKELKSKHELKSFPDYATDWQKLMRWAKESLESIPDAIGGKVRLERNELVSEVQTQIEYSKYCGIIGPSGSGKSVLAKRAAIALAGDNPVIWFSAEEFSSSDFESLPSRLQLSHSLPDILGYLPTKSGIVVLDGLERLATDDAYKRLKRLLLALGVGIQTSSWNIIFSCQSERWEYVQGRLIQLGFRTASVAVVQLKQYLEAAELSNVRDEFPNLYKVLFRSNLQYVLHCPKVLDILAAQAVRKSAVNPSEWVGESDLIEWYWNSVIHEPNDGPERSAMVQELGERQADRGESESPLLEIGIKSTGVIWGLERDGVCRKTKLERLCFTHDLIADWSRQRVLVSHTDLPQYLSNRSSNPLWHKAIRLYGLHLIEGKNGVQEWSEARTRLMPIEDLLLDSVVLAANAKDLLEKLWTTLTTKNGDLLRRLLRRFLHVATYPDPIGVRIGESQPDIAGFLRATVRRPHWPYWVNILPFLHAHMPDVVRLASLEVARITTIWLRYSGKGWLYRKEAAELAVAVGEATWLARLNHPYSSDEDDVSRYEAALAAASELPDQVADLTLRACARKLTPIVESGQVGEYKAPGTPVRVPTRLSIEIQHPQPEPWPDGPKYRIDDAFQKACLSQGALIPLMTARPAIAAGAILALIIEPRTPASLDEYSELNLDRTGVDDLHEFNPPLYDKGPFWLFLITAPEVAIDCIIRLIDFATERWIATAGRNQSILEPFEVVFPDEIRSYRGDWHVCGWYRGASAPGIVASALMALEKWIYDQLESGNCIDRYCELILKGAKSNAFLGLLWEVGRSKLELFKGVLRPLLNCAALYFWESEALRHGLNQYGLLCLVYLPNEVQKKHREWEELKHRRIRVQNQTVQLFVFDDSMIAFFGNACTVWKRQLGVLGTELKYGQHIAELLALFDRKNWRETTNEQGQRGMTYVPPPQHAKIAEKARQDMEEFAPYHYVLQARQLLERNVQLNPVQLPQLLELIKKLEKRVHEEKEYSERCVTAIIGCIAVLAKLHWQWLAEDTQRLDWCRSTLVRFLSNPPAVDEIESAYDKSALSWEDFAAQALVPFWVQTPQDQEIRFLVARAAMAKHYSAVALLTHAAFEQRQALGDDFGRLITFILNWAFVRYDVIYRRRDKSVVDLSAWFAEHGRQFIDGKTPVRWDTWGQDAISRGYRREIRPRHDSSDQQAVSKAYAVQPHIDQQLISSAFNVIFRLSGATSDAERKSWLSLWHQVVECFTAAHDARTAEGDRIVDRDLETGPIYDYDRWAGRQICELILDMRPEEQPQTIVRSIIDLGPVGYQWIEAFLWEWWWNNLKRQDTAKYLGAWKEMLAYALESSVWREKDKCWPHWDDFWLNLMGIDQHLISSWTPNDASIVTGMIECLAQWLPQNLSDRWIARAFLVWLQLPSSRSIRPFAVSWLLPVVRNVTDYWWDNEEHTSVISQVLDQLWREDRKTITDKPDLQKEYRELVSIAARRQNPLAMDLQERMGTPQL